MGFRILATSKGSGVRFTNSDLDRLNSEYRELEKIYESSQTELIKMVVNTCG